MYESFSTAVRLDPQAVRQALPRPGAEPEETRLISLALYLRQHRQRRLAKTQSVASVILDYVARLARAEAELAAGQGTAAVEVLEDPLRENLEDLFAVLLLVLAYLLLRATGKARVTAAGQGSMLRQGRLGLAKFLFQRNSS